MNTRIILLLSMLLLLAGCLPLSVHPLYSDSTVVVEPGIVGWWSPEEEDDERWVFEQHSDSSYRLIVTERDSPDGVFVANVLKLQSGTYLDLFPEEPESGNEYFNLHLIPAHSFYRMRLEGNVLLLAYIDPTWFKDKVEDGTLTIAHESRKNLLVLTAATEELQQFVVQYADEAFDEDDQLIFKRRH